MAVAHDVELDVRGEACPYPLIRTKQRVDRLQKGEVLKVLASDPVAPQNIDAWAKKSGNELLAVEANNGTFNILSARANIIFSIFHMSFVNNLMESQ